MFDLLEATTEALQGINATKPFIDPQSLSSATTLTSRMVGFMEACALLEPDLLTDVPLKLAALELAVIDLSSGRAPRDALSVVDPGQMTDRRTSARAESAPRRQAMRRTVLERRTAERRNVADRRRR